jgi:hypothetical protein
MEPRRIRRNRPGAAAPGWLLTGGLLAFAVGDVAHVVQAADGDDRLGSPAEAIYLLGYLSQITGMVLMVRRRTPGRDLGSLVDALIVAGAFALPAWVFLIGPLAAANLELLGRISAVAMPTLDLTLLVLLGWLLTAGDSRSVTFVLIVISYVRCEGRRRRSGRGR